MNNTAKKEDDRAERQALAQIESIEDMVENLKNAIEEGDDCAKDNARQTISEDPLSIQVREDWHSPSEKGENTEFNILLCWGGPAVRIVGDIGLDSEPENVRVEYQDWFTGWEEYRMTEEQEEAVLTYCRQFYFDE